MKRVLAFVLLFVILSMASITVFATNAENNGAEGYEIKPADLSVESNSAVLMEAQTGAVLFSHNENEAESPASVTKIMTLLLVAEAIADGRISADDNVSISAYAAGMGGSQVFLEEGERMSVLELIKCTVIASANDAAVALAEHISGSEDSFVRRMNERAAELGMENTNFENVTGLDDTTENHVTSALDIAKMSRELLKHSIIREYSSLWQDSIRNGEFVLTNTNRLVRYYDGCTGLKTGSTDKAGFCISATAKRDGMELIAVVMGAPTRDVRNKIAAAMLDYGFANYALFTENGQKLESVPVYCGVQDSVDVYSKPFSALVHKSDLARITKHYEIPEYVRAPISCGDEVGKVIYKIDGKMLGESKLFVKTDVDEMSLWDLFLRLLRNVFTAQG